MAYRDLLPPPPSFFSIAAAPSHLHRYLFFSPLLPFCPISIANPLLCSSPLLPPLPISIATSSSLHCYLFAPSPSLTPFFAPPSMSLPLCLTDLRVPSLFPAPSPPLPHGEGATTRLLQNDILLGRVLVDMYVKCGAVLFGKMQ